MVTKMLRIFAVGKMKDKRLAGLLGEYIKRCRPLSPVEVVEIKDSTSEKEDRELTTRLAATSGTGLVVAMDEKGEDLDSERFAKLLEGHGSISFVVGGADGLGPEIRQLADRTVRLSSLTWTHEMARVLLAEQIYRGLSILRGKPYHRR
jgi:23S rRNA (pseudouridine1915-N3)-methyltransferase